MNAPPADPGSMPGAHLLLLDTARQGADDAGLCLPLRSVRVDLRGKGTQHPVLLYQGDRWPSPQLADSARHGALQAQRLLERERLLGRPQWPVPGTDVRESAGYAAHSAARWTALTLDVELPDLPQADVVGPSADLLFALATLRAVLNRPVFPFAATGELNDQGYVQAVAGVPAKLRAALGVRPTLTAFAYPAENDTDIDLALRQRAGAVGLRLFPVRRLAEAIKALDPDFPVTQVWLGSPWRGLLPYGHEHRAIFIGRQREEDRMVQLLFQREAAGCPGALVLAASGAGKSSFLQAGVLPSLMHRVSDGRILQWWAWRPSSTKGRDEAGLVASVWSVWPRATLVGDAGTTPANFVDLADRVEASHHPQTRLLWLIDPFEDIFTQGIEPDAVNAFAVFALRLQSSVGLWLLGGVQTRFLDHILQHQQLASLFGDRGGTVPLGRMDLEPLRDELLPEVITRPAELAGLTLERRTSGESLLGRITADLAHQPDALPLLSDAMDQLFEAAILAQRKELRITDYNEFGGLKGAIRTRADVALADPALSPETRAELPRLLRALIHVSGEGLAVTPRDLPLGADWAEQTPGRQLVDALVQRRLLIRDDAEVSAGGLLHVRVVHRVLLDHWVAAQQSSTEQLDLAATRDRLSASADGWDKAGRLPGALARSEKDLADARVLKAKLADDLQGPSLQLLSRFVDASLKQADDLEQAALRAQRFRRRSWAGAALVLLVLLLLVALKWREANEHLLEATKGRLEAQAFLILSGIRPGAFADGARMALAAYRLKTERSEALNALSPALYGDKKWLFKRLIDQPANVTSVAFSRDGRHIVSGSWDSTVHLWDAATGRPIGTPLKGHERAVTSVAFSPDGRHIVSGSEDRTVRLWDATTGRPIGAPLKGHEHQVLSVAFSPDGRQIVSGSRDRRVRLWDAVTGQPIGAPLIGHEGGVSSVAFSPNGRHIVSGGEDRTARLWDAVTGKPIGAPLTGHLHVVSSVAFSPNGRYIVSGSWDRTVHLWDAVNGQPIGAPLKGHEDDVFSVAYSPDGRHIVSGSRDHAVRVWDAVSGEPIGAPLQGHEHAVNSVAFSPDGRHIVSGSEDRTVRLWDAVTGHPTGAPPKGHERHVLSVAWSPDGRHFVSGSEDGTVQQWDAVTGQPIGAPLKGHKSGVSSVAFSPNGRHIVSGSWDRTVRLWDAVTGQPVGLPMLGHEHAVSSVAFSPDGRHIASGSEDRTVRLVDAVTRELLAAPLKVHKEAVSSVAFSPDGRHIVSGSRDQAVRVWDAVSGQPIGAPLLGHEGAVSSVAFSPDGRHIVSGGEDRTVRLWDAFTGQPIGSPLKGHEDAVSSVAFSLDGRHIGSGSRDRTVRLWDAVTEQPIGAPLKGHEDAVSSVAFSPDGRHIVSGSLDRTVRLWNAPKSWPALICQVLTRNWSRKQWQEFVGSALPYASQCPDLPVPEDDE